MLHERWLIAYSGAMDEVLLRYDVSPQELGVPNGVLQALPVTVDTYSLEWGTAIQDAKRQAEVEQKQFTVSLWRLCGEDFRVKCPTEYERLTAQY